LIERVRKIVEGLQQKGFAWGGKHKGLDCPDTKKKNTHARKKRASTKWGWPLGTV